MAAVLLALGVPLAVSLAAARQQEVVVDRIDDTARFASLAQFVTERPSGSRVDTTDGRGETLQRELEQYYKVYGIKAGVFYRELNQLPMANAPASGAGPPRARGSPRSRRLCWGAVRTARNRCGPGRRPACRRVPGHP